MANVIVLAGGTSDEHEVSVRSGAAVARALAAAGYEVTTLDPANGLEQFLPKLQAADAIFPALHGAGGEDGELQKFLEAHKIRYVGADSQASALCFDKARYADLLMEHGIVTPATEVADQAHFEHSALRQRPFVLKPNDGGSSIDTFIVREPTRVDVAAIKQAFQRHRTMLLQALIEGIEITVPVVGSKALPVIEIIPPAGGEFDYENKYNGQTQELCPPKHVGAAVQKQAQALAEHIHHLTGCRDMSRTDFIVTPAHALYVLETNTIPGLTGESLLPKAAHAAGMDMAALCDRLMACALQRNT